MRKQRKINLKVFIVTIYLLYIYVFLEHATFDLWLAVY